MRMGSRSFRVSPLLALLPVLLLGAATPAAAASEHARRWEKGADLGQKEEERLDSSLKADLSRPKKKEEARRPALRFEQFRRRIELQVAEKRREQIRTLSQIIELGPSDEEAPGLLFRAAELYWEEAQYYFFLANEKDDDIIAAKERGDQRAVARLESEKQQLLEESERWRSRAIDSYRQIVKRYSDFERLDEVLYSLGSNLWEQGKIKQALKVYKVLIRRYPESEYVPDAYLAFGEAYFDQGNVRSALKAYQRASSFTESKVYGYAMYKQGWCYYNLGDYERAMDTWKAVIFYGDIASGVSGENKLALVREARRDYVLAYSHIGDPKTAKEDFQTVGGEEWEKMFSGLGSLYYDGGKDKEAIVVYRTLLKDKPISPEAPGWQARIVDAARRIGNKRYTVKQARLLVRVFREVEKAGVVKTKKEKEALEEARDFAERTLRTLAVEWHSEAKKTRDDATFYYAYEMYSDYVTLFPDTKYAYDMHFYFGELLFYLEKYQEAAEQYEKAFAIDEARLSRGEKPGKFFKQAAVNAIFAWEEVARAFEEKEARPDVPATTPLEIPPPKQALLEAGERYLKYFPKGEKVVEVTYKIANIFYRYNRFDEAVRRFAFVALEHPEHELAEYAANLILDSYNLLGQPEKVNEWARRLHANRKLAKGKFKQDLEQVIEDSALTMIEAKAKRGDHAAAARAYEGFVKEFPRSKKADEALFNASAEWAKAKRVDRALSIRSRLIERYPDSDLVPEALYSLAAGYEALAEFLEAARYYEMYAARWEKERAGSQPRGKKRRRRRAARPATASFRYDEAKAQEALFNAGVLREGLGQYEKARADRLKYVSLWPAAKDAKAVFLSVAKLYEAEKKWLDAVAHLDAYLRDYAGKDVDDHLLVRLRQAKLLERAGRRGRAAAEKKYQEILAFYEGLGRRKKRVKAGLLAVATAELKRLDGVMKQYQSVRLEYPWAGRGNPKQLIARLKAAGEVLERAQAEGRQEFTPAEVKVLLAAKKAKALFEKGVAASDARFKRSLEAKSKAMREVAAKYTKVVKYKQGEPALCALEKLGNLYLRFVDDVREGPLPPYLTEEEQRQQFRDLLAQQALPVEEQAVEAYSAAVAKSRELMIYNGCAKRALAALKRLRPEAWPEVVELRVEPDSAQELTPPKGHFLLTELVAPEPAGTGVEVPAARVDRRSTARSPAGSAQAGGSSKVLAADGPSRSATGSGGDADEPDDSELLP